MSQGTNDEDLIKLRMDQGSVRTLDQLDAQLQAQTERLQELVSLSKRYNDLLKTMQLRARTAVGADAFARGYQTQETFRARQTARAGNPVVQADMVSTQMVKNAKERTRALRDAESIQRAMKLNLEDERRGLKKITDVQRLLNTQKEAELRLGLEREKGDKKAEASAKRLLRDLEKRIQLLKEQEDNLIGGNRGQVIANRAAGFREFQAQLRQYQASERMFGARNLDLTKITKELEKITDLEALRTMEKKAQDRLNMSLVDGSKADAKSAERALDLIRQRRTEIKDIERLQRRNFAGGDRGLELAQIERINREQRSLISQERTRRIEQQASALNLNMQAEGIRRITNAEKLRNLELAVQKRAQTELLSGNFSAEAQAKKLLDTIRQQTQELRRQESLQGRIKALTSDGGAGLFAIQGLVSANYMILGGLQNMISQSMTFTGALDEELRNLQAITVVTDENLEGLRDTILDVSEATKFGADELARTAVTLGQAGFSVQEIKDSLAAVALLATATGTDLSQSADIITSVLGVFAKESSQMIEVSNTLTAAINGSKLSLDKIALGLQYAGNTAAQSGVSFEELTASLGAMANAGIRSGSTLGTGMRQILISLQKPSKEFRQTLDRLGLTLADVDVRTKGLYGVMKTLQESGFSAADAIRSFEVRAASAFNALAGNIDQMVELEESFLNSTAAIDANETQMRALNNQSKRLAANFNAVVATGVEPVLLGLRDMISLLADLFEMLRQFPLLLQLGTSGLTLLAGAFAISKLIKLAGGLKDLGGSLGFFSASAETAGRKAKGLNGVLLAMTGPVGALRVALGLGAVALLSYANEWQKLQQTLERAQTTFDNQKGEAEKLAGEISIVGDRIVDLERKASSMNDEMIRLEVQKVIAEFTDMGLTVDENTNSIDTLVGSLQELQAQLAQKYELQLEANTLPALENLRAVQELTARQSVERVKNIAPLDRNSALVPFMSGGLNDALVERIQGLSDLPSISEIKEVQRLVMEEQTRLLNKQSSGDLGWREDLTLKAMEDIMAMLNQAVTEVVSLSSTDRELERTRRDSAVAQARADNPGLMATLQNLEGQAIDRVNDAVKAAGSNSMDQFEAVREIEEAVLSEGKRLLAEAPEELQGEIQSRLNEVYGMMARETQKYAELATEYADMVSEASATQTATVEKALKSQLENARSAEEIDAITERRLANNRAAAQASVDAITTPAKLAGAKLTAQDNAEIESNVADNLAREAAIMSEANEAKAALLEGRMEQLQRQLEAVMERMTLAEDEAELNLLNQKATNLTGEVNSLDQQRGYLAGEEITALVQEAAEREKEVTDQYRSSLAGLRNIQRDEIRRRVDALNKSLENPTSEAEIAEIRDELNALAEQDQELQLELADLTIENAAKRRSEKKDIVAATAAQVEANNKAALEAEIAEIESELKLAETALRETMLLAEAAKGLKEQNDLLEKAVVEIAQIAEIRKNLATKQTELNPQTDEQNEAEASTYVLNLEKQLQGLRDRLTRERKSGSGRSKEDKKDEVDKLIDRLRAKIGAAQVVTDAGGTSNLNLDTALDEASAKLSEINDKVAAFDQKAANGTLSKKEQEDLNTLLEQQSKLTDEIASKEQALISIRMQQGEFSEALAMSMRVWSEENLNMAKAMEDGVGNVLSGLQGALQNLISDVLSGTKSMGEAFKDFGRSIMKSLMDVIAKLITIKVLQMALGIAAPNASITKEVQAVNAMKMAFMAQGGAVPNYGTNRDSVPTMLMPDEVVMNRSAVQMIGKDNLLAMNALGNRAISQSGVRPMAEATQGDSRAKQTTMNIYMVDERKNVPSLGPSDVLAIVGDDIARGGPTKKLIKTIQTGEL